MRVLAITEIKNTTTAEKKKMVAVEDHIPDRLEASAATSTIPWVTISCPIWFSTGRADKYRFSGYSPPRLVIPVNAPSWST